MLQPLNNQTAIPLSKWLVCAINGQTVLMRSPIYPKPGLVLCTGKITSCVDSLLRDESISFSRISPTCTTSSIQPQVPAFAFSAVLCLGKTSRKFLGILAGKKIWILFSWEHAGMKHYHTPGWWAGDFCVQVPSQWLVLQKQNLFTLSMALP